VCRPTNPTPLLRPLPLTRLSETRSIRIAWNRHCYHNKYACAWKAIVVAHACFHLKTGSATRSDFTIYCALHNYRDADVYKSSELGDSQRSLNAANSCAPSTPSITRWSHDSVTVKALLKRTVPSGPSDGRRSAMPTARMAA
jgi:hypothetical protein